MQLPLILVSDYIHTSPLNGSGPISDDVPRRDFLEIARELEARLVGYGMSDAAWYRWTRRFERSLKFDVIESWRAAGQASEHNVVLSTSEKVGIPLAAALCMMRREMPHVVIGHRLSSIFKSPFFRLWQLHQNFSRVICVCRAQLDFAVNKLGIPESNVDFVYDKVDHYFFRPLTVETADYILAVGKEQRDYQTLSRALSGTGLKLIVVASSPWSTYRPHINRTENVTVLSRISYQALRDLYARARLVVVPLFEVDHAAGVNTLLEAMAMGKPAIVSRTQGITDYVTHRETGIYVSPRDVAELRDAILSLWEHPGELRRLGENGRQAVEEGMNLDTYVNKIVQIVYETVAASQG